MSGVALRVRGLGKRFERRWVFRALDLDLEVSDSLVVAGRNGAGKSTLLKILAGVIPATEGEVAVEGCQGEQRNLIGLCSPEQSLYEALTGTENLRFFARLRGLKAFDPHECLRRIGLQGRGDERVSAYSTGMKQRLRLALATMHEPPVLLLDEPGAGLDEEGRSIVDGIFEHARSRGIVIVATNDRSEYRYGERRLELGC
ncbi:MAG: ABC transporter ATP-binding protein [Fimbriimonadia bacterium]|jgi:ABC-type multidrug transport system ATPase subunit